MVKIMENPIKMDDLGYHYFRKHPYNESKQQYSESNEDAISRQLMERDYFFDHVQA